MSLIWIIFATLFSSLAQISIASVEYYEQRTCEEQALDSFQISNYFRDKGRSEREAVNYLANKKKVASLRTATFIVQQIYGPLAGNTSNQIKEFTISSCVNRGKDVTNSQFRTGFSIFGVTGKEGLSSDEFAACTDQWRRINAMREKLTDYEQEIPVVGQRMEESYNRIVLMGSNASESTINSHNSIAVHYERLVSEYEVLGDEYNRKTQIYNKECANKVVPR